MLCCFSWSISRTEFKLYTRFLASHRPSTLRAREFSSIFQLRIQIATVAARVAFCVIGDSILRNNSKILFSESSLLSGNNNKKNIIYSLLGAAWKSAESLKMGLRRGMNQGYWVLGIHFLSLKCLVIFTLAWSRCHKHILQEGAPNTLALGGGLCLNT